MKYSLFYELHRLTVYHGKRVSLHVSSTIHLRSCTIKITTLFSAQLRFFLKEERKTHKIYSLLYELHRLTVYHGKRVSLHVSSTIHLRSCTIKITTLFSAQLRFFLQFHLCPFLRQSPCSCYPTLISTVTMQNYFPGPAQFLPK